MTDSVVHIIDGDDEAQAELIKVAGTDQFDHPVDPLRAEREDRRRHDEAAAAFAAKGYTVLERRPGVLTRADKPPSGDSRVRCG